MKKGVSIILILCMVLTMAACGILPKDPADNPGTTAAPTDPTTAPTDPVPPLPETIRFEVPSSKENVAEFMALFNERFPKLARDQYIHELNFYNETPPGVFEETGIQIFTCNGWEKSILMFDNELYCLDSFSFFLGTNCEVMTNAVPYDYDRDGTKDLIITYRLCRGGSYDHAIKVFNPVTKEFTTLYYEEIYTGYPALYITTTEVGGQMLLTVWTVNWKCVHGKPKTCDLNGREVFFYPSATVEYTFTGLAGYLKPVDGVLTYVPYNG